MNNKKYLVLAAFTAASVAYTFGQNMIDGVRFGSTDISGTARYRSMAGAFGALGGDASCMSDNPAGLAIYRGTNTFNVTPHVGFTNTENYGTVKATGKDNNFSVSNFSTIFSFMPDNDNLVNFNVGFSIERRLQTFRKMNMEFDKPGYLNAVNAGRDPGSFGGYLFEQANSYLEQSGFKAEYLGTSGAWSDNSVPLLSLMGFESYALDYAQDDPYHVDNPIFDNVYQKSNLLERTRHDNYNLSAAVNISDVLYAGMTIRITDFNSLVEHCFSEDSQLDMKGDYITYDNRTETKGSGLGINLGVLWKPTEAWRLGFALHTPTWMNMKEFHDASMEAFNINYEAMLAQNPSEQNWSDWNDETEYDYSTPWEYQFSTAYVFGSRAILSLEYDLRDFTTMKFHAPKFGNNADRVYFDDMNETQKQYLQAQHTIKAGLEYRVAPRVSLRLGYAYKSSPYTKEGLFTDVKQDDISFLYRTATKPNYTTLDDQHYFTGGIGWRGKTWTFDLACVSHHMMEYYSPYPCDFAPSDIFDFKTHQLNWDLSIGYRF